MKNASSFWKWLLCDWLGWHDTGLPTPRMPLSIWNIRYWDGRCLRCGRNLLSAIEVKDEEK